MRILLQAWKLFAFPALGVMSFVTLASVRVTANSDELPDIATVCSRITANMDKLQQILIDVKIERKAQNGISEGNISKWLSKGSGGTTQETFGMKGEMRFLRQKGKRSNTGIVPEVNANDSPAMQKRAQAIRDEYDLVMKQLEARHGDSAQFGKGKAKQEAFDLLRAFDGTILREFDRLKGTGKIVASNAEIGRGDFQSLFFQTIAWFIDNKTYSEEMRVAVSGGLLPRTLELAEYTISEDTLNGVDCLKLVGETGVGSPVRYADTIWLSKPHNLMVVQRELRELKTDEILYRAICGEPKEIIESVWLPQHCSFEEYAPANAPKDIRTTPLLVTTLKVTQSTAQLSDSQFLIEFPPGTMIADSATAEARGFNGKMLQYRMPADPKDIDKVIEKAAYSLTKRPSRTVIGMSIGFGLAMIALIGFLRRYRS